MPETSITLLQTKLHRPRPSSDLVLRPRLFERLHAGLNRPLTLVSAPAGFGKTTLVSSWIESLSPADEAGFNRLPAAWLSLDNNDSELTLFTQYLIAALRTIFISACPESLRLVQDAQSPPVTLLSTTLSNEIERLPGSFILVLDDFYTIQGEAVADLLAELLQHWPTPLHLVLVSRNNPPLPLPRLRANGALVEIRSNDLRFDKFETNAFLSRALQTSLSEPVVEILTERTEGWIAALRLASLSLRADSTINDRVRFMTGLEENIADYLADEVLAHQFPAIQTFLLKTSVLDRFCTSLCEAIIGEGDPAWKVGACIDWLERRELFIIPLDNQKVWYRYHHIFRSLLQQRCSAEMTPETVADLHRRASGWFEQEGLLDEAFKHALLSNDLDLVSRLMEHGLCDLLNREDRLTLQSWKRLLPEEFIQDRPWLLMIKAWTLHFSWQLKALSKCLSQI